MQSNAPLSGMYSTVMQCNEYERHNAFSARCLASSCVVEMKVVHCFVAGSMALVSADTKIAELLTELHQLIKQTQVSGSDQPKPSCTSHLIIHLSIQDCAQV